MKSTLILGAGILAVTAAFIYFTNRSASLSDEETPSSGISVTCEKTRSGSELSSARLFDGPPSENAELAPDDESKVPLTWTFSSPSASKIGYFLGCYYTDHSSPDVYQIPEGSTCTGMNDENLICT